MNRDAQMAVVAARLAMEDAGVRSGATYASEDIALFGATGMTGLPVEEISRLVECSAGQDGSLDLNRLGQVGLKRVRPVLSFKILANIPICFVSIFEGIRGENGVYTPWEGQGARAIEAGVRAIRQGRAACALVGGCDVKTHEFSFISLQQLGVFDSWRDQGRGIVPGEGAAFLVLENESAARDRGGRMYARFARCSFATAGPRVPLAACPPVHGQTRLRRGYAGQASCPWHPQDDCLTRDGTSHAGGTLERTFATVLSRMDLADPRCRLSPPPTANLSLPTPSVPLWRRRGSDLQVG